MSLVGAPLLRRACADIAPPTITCADGEWTVADVYPIFVDLTSSATATDNVGVSSVTFSPNGPFYVGTTAVTATATDAAGHTATCTLHVTVTGAAQNTLSCPSATTILTTPTTDGSGGDSYSGSLPAVVSDANPAPAIQYTLIRDGSSEVLNEVPEVSELALGSYQVQASDSAGAVLCVYALTIAGGPGPRAARAEGAA